MWMHLVMPYTAALSVNKQPRWVPPVVTKVFGTRSVNVRVFSRGLTWHRHTDQLCLCYGVEDDADPGEAPMSSMEHPKSKPPRQGEGDALDGSGTNARDSRAEKPAGPSRRNPRITLDDQYRHHNFRH